MFSIVLLLKKLILKKALLSLVQTEPSAVFWLVTSKFKTCFGFAEKMLSFALFFLNFKNQLLIGSTGIRTLFWLVLMKSIPDWLYKNTLLIGSTKGKTFFYWYNGNKILFSDLFSKTLQLQNDFSKAKKKFFWLVPQKLKTPWLDQQNSEPFSDWLKKKYVSFWFYFIKKEVSTIPQRV